MISILGAPSRQLTASIAAAQLSPQDYVITPQAPNSGVCVSIGAAALSRLTPAYKLNDIHCYPLRVGALTLIPALDPIDFFKRTDNSHWIAHALRRAKALDSGTPWTALPHIRIAPSFTDAQVYLSNALSAPELSIDIETTVDTHEITAIAVAHGSEVMSIPLCARAKEPYWTESEEAAIWLSIAKVLASPTPKVFQNFIFDTLVLRKYGVETRGPIYDTMVVAGFLSPELPKGLADLGRTYLFVEPWKGVKDFSLSDNIEAFWTYNAKDAAFTLAIARAQREELRERKLERFYLDRIEPLCPLVLDACTRGMRVNVEALKAADQLLADAIAPLDRELKALAQGLTPPKQKKRKLRDKENDKDGKKAYKTVVDEVPQDFNPASPLQVKAVLNALGYNIPKHKGKESTDRRDLLKLHRKRPSKFIELLLRRARLAKLQSSYTSLALDDDSRLRYSFNVAGTKSGRFSSQGTPWSTGLNIQTIPRKSHETPIDLRDLFLPDDGMTLVQVDLSQAELRVVAWLSQDETLCKLLESGVDIHRYTAEQVTKLTGFPCPRQLGKMAGHAANYGMGAHRFADACLVQADIVITPDEASKILTARSRTFPGIGKWHQAVENQVRRTRRLSTPHGRERYFFGEISDETIREALSYKPQAIVVDTLNAAWIELAKDPAYGTDFYVHMQGHDSLLLSVKPIYLADTIAKINLAFSKQPVIINGRSYLIPWDVTQGSSWSRLQAVQAA